jgi:hypothetical protein
VTVNLNWAIEPSSCLQINMLLAYEPSVFLAGKNDDGKLRVLLDLHSYVPACLLSCGAAWPCHTARWLGFHNCNA